jgi:predicted ribosomally synthesized peptide with SipW-like signal peptide
VKKVKYIALILVLALGLIGGAYAAWTDQLQVNGTVATGDIDVVFTSAVSNDPAGTDDPASPEDDPKDVGVTEVSLSEDGKTMTVTIDNAYPGYVSEIDYAVTNNGSVPVRLQNKTIDVTSGDPAALEVDNGCLRCWLEENGFPRLLWVWMECRCGEDNVLEIGSQIHDGDTFIGTISHLVTDAAEMNGSYTYTITYDFVQWNNYQSAAE